MRITRMIGAALAAGVLLAGCGSGGDDNAAQSSTAGGAPAPAVEQAEPAQADQGDQAAQGGAADTAKNEPAQAPDLSVDQRSIIYTGNITVRVKDVDAAAARATGYAGGAGGFVGADNRSSGGGGNDNASLTLRVPAEKFADVVNQLAGLGEEVERGINTEDVTEQSVDLDARITVQQARVDSGRKLLARANSLTDLVMLEREVATRESDLASLQAKKRRLADLTALSTITAVLLGPAAATPGDDDPAPGFLAGLRGGWDALVASLSVLVTVMGALLPWLIALGLPLWAVIWAFRRYRRKPAMPALPADPTPEPAETT
jgi:Domain of unknown function (DUF4349)